MRAIDIETLRNQETLADIEALLAEDMPRPGPARRQTARARARALDAFDRTHRRGIGAAVARHLYRSSAPAWHLIGETLESPWTATVLRLATSLIAAIAFTIALVVMFMVVG